MEKYIEIKGKYNKAKIYTDKVDEGTISQVMDICGEESFGDSKIRIMPDCHQGKGCVIGTTMTITDKVVPNLVGVDIGCGVSFVSLKDTEIDFEKLDSFIRENIPFGQSVRGKEHKLCKEAGVEKLRCIKAVNKHRATLSCGTLGGGNHFIEMGRSSDGTLSISVHSGSRYLGKQVAEHYQSLAYRRLADDSLEREALVNSLKKQGRQSEIADALEGMKKPKVRKDMAYLTGSNLVDYLHDIAIVQKYAVLNRKAIIDDIVSGMGLHKDTEIESIHNYIDTDSMILRKGAICAEEGKLLVIPINMRDGIIVAKGKGNEDWNCSAPHGAGRILSRGQAKESLSMEEFKSEMSGVWSSCVREGTLDEAPMAYKPIDEITENIEGTAEILYVVKPIYNFKG